MNNTKKTDTTGVSGRVLIPVDFSARCNLAVRLGFEIARRLDRKVTLLHASVIPTPGLFPQFPDDFNGLDNENFEIEEMELSSIVHKDDEKRMEELVGNLKAQQTEGTLPMIEFDNVISEGMPEEVIKEYCELKTPYVVVMATRGREKREEELIGSVTAEVIDNVRVPVFTVPEEYHYVRVEDIVRICVFCHLDGNDFDSINSLMKMFDDPSIKVWLFPVTDKFNNDNDGEKMQSLQRKLSNAFSDSEFYIFKPDAKNIRNSVEDMFAETDIQLILAPNKRRSFLARLFKPGLAHRILFEKDIPMLVMPV